MAIFPCDLCRKRYAGRGNSIYIGWMQGGFSDRRKLNLCPAHVDLTIQSLAKHLTLIERGGVMQSDSAEISSTCETCGLEPTTQTWFANTYERNSDPSVFARGVCEKCAQVLRSALPVSP